MRAIDIGLHLGQYFLRVRLANGKGPVAGAASLYPGHAAIVTGGGNGMRRTVAPSRNNTHERSAETAGAIIPDASSKLRQHHWIGPKRMVYQPIATILREWS